jgi:hypothetical protein
MSSWRTASRRNRKQDKPSSAIDILFLDQLDTLGDDEI